MRVLLAAGLWLLALEAATAPVPAPALDPARTRPVVVVAQFESVAAQYAENPECRDPNVWCLDPPPFAMRLRVLEHVWGPRQPRHLEVIVTDHMGQMMYPQADPTRWLVFLLTDGKATWMRRYARTPVYDSTRDGHVLAGATRVGWLPCEVRRPRPMNFRQRGVDVRVDIRDFSPEDRAELVESMIFDGDVARPRPGYWPTVGQPVRALARALRRSAPTLDQMHCEEPASSDE